MSDWIDWYDDLVGALRREISALPYVSRETAIERAQVIEILARAVRDAERT